MRRLGSDSLSDTGGTNLTLSRAKPQRRAREACSRLWLKQVLSAHRMGFARCVCSMHLSKLLCGYGVKMYTFHLRKFYETLTSIPNWFVSKKQGPKYKQDTLCAVLGDCGSLISWPQATECNQIFATSLKTPTEVVRLPRSCWTLLSYSSQIYMIMRVSVCWRQRSLGFSGCNSAMVFKSK